MSRVEREEGAIRVTLWGTRGSLASPGPETVRYGGNTACVEVLGSDGTLLVLDAGTGIRGLGMTLHSPLSRVDVLLSHLHMDHIQGLGFFAPLRDAATEVHIWGPGDADMSLREGLSRYLSPPLFPLSLFELPCKLYLHELPAGEFQLGAFRVRAETICHTDPALGYRIELSGATVTYIPDHEPAFCEGARPEDGRVASGLQLADGADLLIHDAQYTSGEYAGHAGWGHSSMRQAFEFAERTGVRELVPFHHHPARTDDELDTLISETVESRAWPFVVTPGREGTTFVVRSAT